MNEGFSKKIKAQPEKSKSKDSRPTKKNVHAVD